MQQMQSCVGSDVYDWEDLMADKMSRCKIDTLIT